MNQVVLTVDDSQMNKIKDYYQPFLTEKTPPGAVFSVKTENCRITAYQSGKILFQGKGAVREAERWKTSGESLNTGNINQESSNLPPNIGSLSVIGSDEVGTGDYFGPIVVCAAYVNKENIKKLEELGVKDSKHLSDKNIVTIAKKIKDWLPHSLLVLQNEKYNDLQESGMSQGRMKAVLHNHAIGHVLKKIAPEKPDAVLIDQFAQEEVYFNHLRGQKEIYQKHVYFSTKAEGIHPAVAAASILARYAFLLHFEQLSKLAGFPLPKGAGKEVDKAAARLIQEKGAGLLRKLAKLHFANTKKAEKLAKSLKKQTY